MGHCGENTYIFHGTPSEKYIHNTWDTVRKMHTHFMGHFGENTRTYFTGLCGGKCLHISWDNVVKKHTYFMFRSMFISALVLCRLNEHTNICDM